MSYANVILYGAVLPSYSSKKKDGKGSDDGEVLNGDDPANGDKIRNILEALG